MASFRSVFQPRVRTIPSVLIIAAALMLGMFVYGFTASATLNNDANLAGGQNSVNGIGFNLLSSSVNYGTFTGNLSVSSVSFVAEPVNGTFSTGVRVFAKLNTDATAAYNDCTTAATIVSANINVSNCAVTALTINSASFGLDVVILE